MKWIGLTGGIGSGKSTASAFLRGEGYTVIDADQIARDVVAKGSSGLSAVANSFGSKILLPDGSLDRKKLAGEVFSSPHSLTQLESILHPLIKAEVARLKKTLRDGGAKLAFYDVPLLFEKKMQGDFDAILLIFCSELAQKSRLKSRNQLTEAEVEARLKNQIPLAQKIPLADVVVNNESSIEDLQLALREALNKLQNA